MTRTHTFTPGLGDATCALCLGAITGDLVAYRTRRTKRGGSYVEAFAHAECALESEIGVWIIDISAKESA